MVKSWLCGSFVKKNKMEVESGILIDDLLRRMAKCTKTVKEEFEHLSNDQLQFKNGERWSILECLEHLNLYGDFYLVEIEKQVIANPRETAPAKFRSGFLGNYFATLMEVKNGKITKMKSPKDKNPEKSCLSITVISRFLKQQDRLVGLLNQCRNVDLTKTKASISLTNLVKLRLGDTLRFYCYHIERHVLQAERALEDQKKMTKQVYENQLQQE
jgi:hypothetical protein